MSQTKFVFSQNKKGQNTLKFMDTKNRMCSIVESEPIGKEPTIWCGPDTADRMRLSRRQAGELGEILTKYSETGSFE
ncbi:hypothetical protein EHQ12_04180 [Leptospira gomenensis]|uniref:Uncharacterized protein n=1 Tax=Leptospira gomenensis TaxID=2484974 RepID=A0A5F1YDV2_9LEPT|nr:hypothetical protein [Leptospira gomenensis]TGK36186.1 hypothetical protein EHQ17_04535 [Leptospira gomenensis]TGK42774.1 hypothetical protein EHQ07_13955 [Leptospira gomenensis]TGK42963.1 hypothetical protein EHQ12_04180 [Leptospira gomenensis]TGK54974.1 hypothetical protein EHQ13_18435 [Leptospira gomenensis]